MILEKWVEKHRPKTLDNIIGQDTIIRELQGMVNNGKNIDDFIFYGEPGVGKTTTALALARDLFGNQWRMAFYRTNASDDRGLDAVRNKIIPATKHMPLIPVPFKIIFLDQADSMTPEAQDGLCIPMEETPGVRFILSCNNISKIIKPIITRCTVYEFKPIGKADIVKRLQFIANREGLTIDMQQLGAIAEMCKGNLRDAIRKLQKVKPPSIEKRQILDISV